MQHSTSFTHTMWPSFQRQWCSMTFRFCLTLRLTDKECAFLNCCWNNVYRRVFKFHRRESVKYYIFDVDHMDLHQIYNFLLLKMYWKLLLIGNDSLNLYGLFAASDDYATCYCLCNNFSVCEDCLVIRIRDAAYNSYCRKCIVTWLSPLCLSSVDLCFTVLANKFAHFYSQWQLVYILK